MNLKPVHDLIKLFSYFPGIGEKSTKKLAYFTILNKDTIIDDFINTLHSIKNDIYICKECGFLTYKSDLCHICNDNLRDHSKIMIVKDIEDVFVFEELKLHDGVYHILGGLISPSTGTTPDDLSIKKLLERIKKNLINEIIIGLPKNSNGTLTSYFIKATG